MPVINELKGEILMLEKRCTQLRMQADKHQSDAERWGKAFDAAVELRELVEQQLTDKINELVDETEQQATIICDATKTEQEYERLVEKVTHDVFRMLDRFRVPFDPLISLRTALDALMQRIGPDPSVPPHGPGEVPFEAREGAPYMLQSIQRMGVHVLLDPSVLTAWWANIAMRGYDECYRKYKPLIDAAVEPKQSGKSPRGDVYSHAEEQAIAAAAEVHVDWSASELQPKPFANLEEVPL